MSRKAKRHAERDSCFFRLKSRAKLARILFSSSAKLERISLNSRGLYYTFPQPKKNGGVRLINAPRDDLKAIQARIANLLQRIIAPAFLFAPVSGRSYVDNAARHLGAGSVRLLDIEDFFPSCTANRIIWFFRTRMECSPDVASILRGIVTLNGCLPQGSPCSPILAYLSYADMWERINHLVVKAECKLSVYADDLTISGKMIPELMIWEIKRTLRRYGHRYNVKKEKSRINRPAEITGVILVRDGLRLPNRQHQKLYEVREALKNTVTSDLREKLGRQLRGLQAQAKQVNSGNETPQQT
jgi:retron-type reverse transcriptase